MFSFIIIGLEMNAKKCSKCHEVKPLVCFHNNNTTKDGKRYDCKSCTNAARRANHRKLHPENVPLSVRLKRNARQKGMVKYGKDLMDLHEYKNDSISYDDAMHEIKGY